MPWYDVLFFVVIATVTGAGFYFLRPKLSERERAYRDETRERYRQGMALTFSPGELVWGVITFLIYGSLIAYGLLR